jgi:heptosyltransferase-2
MDGISADAVSEAVRTLTPHRRAVFFDRDGTLCRDADYLNRWEDFSVFPEIDAIDALKGAGFSLVGVSNQSGIGRGIVDESFTRDVNRVFIERYGFDDFLYCPHRPEELCFCRKPEPAMLIEAKERLGIDLRKSYVVGDKDDDMLLARAVGARGILVTTGKLRESVHADHTARDLREATRFILEDGHER